MQLPPFLQPTKRHTCHFGGLSIDFAAFNVFQQYGEKILIQVWQMFTQVTLHEVSLDPLRQVLPCAQRSRFVIVALHEMQQH